ncbi:MULTISPECIES: hemolysin III family protein [unclassified Corynebacterium]|uniref:PAQR family membrane homeostasis protein TrhA n=1 Tax=unclassified Corynebacterium TaxID=2624378 RepID=UPI003526523A
MVSRTIWRTDRGPRPGSRGWIHFFAAILAVFAGSVLATYSWLQLPWWQAGGVMVYAVGVVILFGVSAAYHLGPWKKASTVVWWRRADHSTIAVFIAATYTPFCLISLRPSTATWVLAVAWGGALISVLMNLLWINHPRWLGVLVYLALGWLIVPVIPQLWADAGSAVLWLLFAGGIVYTVGALIYAFKWPGRDARWMGYHEWFHLATVIAAVAHFVAVWIVVAQAVP